MIEAMDLVYEQDVSFLETCQNGGQIPGPFNNRAAGHLNVGTHFMGNNIGQSCFAEAGKSVKEDVVKGFSPALGGGDADLEILFELLLADILMQASWSEIGLESVVLHRTAG